MMRRGVAFWAFPVASSAQGTGPPDMGIASDIFLAVWLFFWLGVLIYPAAGLAYVVWRLANRVRSTPGATGNFRAFVKWSCISHVSLTAAAMVYFAFN